MPGNELLSPELRRAVGVSSAPITYLVEKGHIKRFAEAVGETNPLYLDEAPAGESVQASLIAPPTFLRVLAAADLPDIIGLVPLKRRLDGGSEWEFFEHVKSGDSITVVAHYSDFKIRNGRNGEMLFAILETIYTDQLGRVVATQKATRILY